MSHSSLTNPFDCNHFWPDSDAAAIFQGDWCHFCGKEPRHVGDHVCPCGKAVPK